MARPVIEVIPRDKDPKLFERLSEEGDEEYASLCSKTKTGRQLGVEPENVQAQASNATHILRLMLDGRMVGFAFVNMTPFNRATSKYDAPYAELILLCRRTREEYPWKGSRLLMDIVIQLAREAGKTAIHLEALNKDLMEKVYKPMGFVELDRQPGGPIEAELTIAKRPGGFSRLKGLFTRKQGGDRKTRRRKTKVRGRK